MTLQPPLRSVAVAAAPPIVEHRSAPLVVSMLPQEAVIATDERPPEETLAVVDEEGHRPAADTAAPIVKVTATITAHKPAPIAGRVAALNERGLDAYQHLKFPVARRLLGSAVTLCRGQPTERACALTHAYLGLVLVGGLQQRALGVDEFKKALAIDAHVRLPAKFLRFDIAEALEDATP